MNVWIALKKNMILATALAEDEMSSRTSLGKGKHAQPEKLQHMISSASEKCITEKPYRIFLSPLLDSYACTSSAGKRRRMI